MNTKCRGPVVKRDCRCKHADHVHGTVTAYNTDQCRCEECSAAKVAWQKKYRRERLVRQWNGRALMVPAVGASRRIKALHTVGWSAREIGLRLGVTSRAIGFVRDEYENIHADYADRFAALYDELWDIRPEGHGPNLARRHAAEQGWLPPLAWDDDTIDDPNATTAPIADGDEAFDEIVVERFIAGQQRLEGIVRTPERVEAVIRMTHAGYTPSQVAFRLGMGTKTVVGDLNYAGITPARIEDAA